MEQFDVAFANRYFDALNGYFHPGEFAKPTRSWQVTFDSAARPEPIILQHMLAGVNTHIDLDLGISVQQIAPGTKLSQLHEDFNRINAVLASQVNGCRRRHQRNLTRVGRRVRRADAAPDLRDQPSGENFPGQRLAIRDASEHATRIHPTLSIWLRDRKVAGQTELIYDPPGLIGLIEMMVQAVAARESRDIVRNIQVLDVIASTPAPIRTVI